MPSPAAQELVTKYNIPPAMAEVLAERMMNLFSTPERTENAAPQYSFTPQSSVPNLTNFSNQNQSFDPVSSSPTSTANTSLGRGLASLSDPLADLGLGAFNPTPMSVGLSGLGILAGIPGLGLATMAGRGIANMMGPVETSPTGQPQVSGVGNTTVDKFGNVVGSLDHVANQAAIQDFANLHGGEVGDAGSGIGAEMGGHEFQKGGLASLLLS